MKTSLLFRLGLLAVVLSCSTTLASAQVSVYTEDAKQPGIGYWSVETNQLQRDYSVVRFYTAQHEKIYEERLEGLCLDLSKGTAACRRTARMLSDGVVRVQQARNNSLVANGLGLFRRAQRTYAAM
ncbi:hypothetical protein SAMN02745146_1665 [Hymenobacter daecheongensis DSM 21074]|uniref:UrcA family protein n=1 Tax=Hymenobacter daecheongensis DSM 21074 TaxID=1121955 RepID=A0A1M6EEI3_9BACT|nr:hypothetical protein [Hymenobacter daecheongensis]SHI83833.1 hypothetical protein SAMN02745146_1665 [Hymenobacter daecheongensis DSM 21074]